jgi:hypothetical protein
MFGPPGQQQAVSIVSQARQMVVIDRHAAEWCIQPEISGREQKQTRFGLSVPHMITLSTDWLRPGRPHGLICSERDDHHFGATDNSLYTGDLIYQILRYISELSYHHA